MQQKQRLVSGHTWAVICFVVVVLGLMGGRAVQAQSAMTQLGPNLVRNGSFEFVQTADGVPDGWTVQWAWLYAPNLASGTAETASSGGRSLYTVMRDTNVPQGWGGRVFQDIPVAEGATYRATAAIKMSNWRSYQAIEGVGIALWWQYQNGSWGDTIIASDPLYAGHFDWRVIEAQVTAPPGAVLARLGLWANAGYGEIWWDDVRFHEVITSDGALALDEPVVRLSMRLDQVMAAGLLSAAEVNWHDMVSLYSAAVQSVDALHERDTSFNRARAEYAVDELARALRGSRIVENRAFWIDEEIMATMHRRADLEELLDLLHSLGVNILYPIVHYNSQTIYPSQVLVQAPQFARWDDDPLTVLIEEARGRGMEVHAWYTVFVANHAGGSMPRLLVDHPEWAARSRQGAVQSAEGGAYWLDPAHPGVQDFLLEALAEGMQRYDLDGLHLDYIRYDGDLQFGQATLDGFHAATGYEGLLIAWGTSQMTAFNTYRQNVISEFVRRVKALRDELRPEIILSAAVASEYEWALTSRMQRWGEWARDGLLDVVIPMIYTSDHALFVSVLDEGLSLASERTPIEAGIGTYMLRPDQLSDQVVHVRTRPTLGSALFAAIHLRQVPTIVSELRSGVFRRPAQSAHGGATAAQVFLDDMVQRLHDQASFVTETWAGAGADVWSDRAHDLRRIADTIAHDADEALALLPTMDLPAETERALRMQLEFALYVRAGH